MSVGAEVTGSEAFATPHNLPPWCTKGEFVADIELSESTESFELDALLLIDSSDELDFRCSNFSRSSSLKGDGYTNGNC